MELDVVSRIVARLVLRLLPIEERTASCPKSPTRTLSNYRMPSEILWATERYTGAYYFDPLLPPLYFVRPLRECKS